METNNLHDQESGKEAKNSSGVGAEFESQLTGLLPCPFCGGNFIVVTRVSKEPEQWSVMCNESDCHMDVATYDETIEEAKKLWNTRTNPINTALVDEVERRMDAVVDAAVEWRQSDDVWSDALEVAVDSLLELRDPPTQAAPSVSAARHEFLSQDGPASSPESSDSINTTLPAEDWQSIADATRALAEGHKRLNEAGVPPASYTVCDDPSCQSLIGHRIQSLAAERDTLYEAAVATLQYIENLEGDVPCDQNCSDCMGVVYHGPNEKPETCWVHLVKRVVKIGGKL